MAISDADLAAKRGLNVELIETLRQTRGTSNESLEGAPEGALRRAIRRLSVPDAPRARLQQQLRKSRGDDGRVPSNAIGRALQQTRILGKRAAAAPRVAGLPVRGALTPLALEGAAGPRPTAAGLSTKRWQWLGPGNVGGRTRSIVVHPKQTKTDVGRQRGGRRVAHRRRRGQSWEPVDDFMANLAVAGAGDRSHQPRRHLRRNGGGLLERRRAARCGHLQDDGWCPLAEQLPSTTGADFQAVNRLAISANGKVLLAATRNGMLRSADPGRADVDERPRRRRSLTSGFHPPRQREGRRRRSDKRRGLYTRPTAGSTGPRPPTGPGRVASR